MVWRLIDSQSNLQVRECQKIWQQHLEAASRSFEKAKWVAHDFEVLDTVMFGKRKKKNSKLKNLRFEKLKFLSCMA